MSVDTKRENSRLMYKEKTILGEAEYHNRSPTLSITPKTWPPWHGGWWRPQFSAVSVYKPLASFIIAERL